jgi:hypothetical protein
MYMAHGWWYVGAFLEPKADGLRDSLGFEDIHDLGDVDLDVRRRGTIKKKE